jgi:hypothetical protein
MLLWRPHIRREPDPRQGDLFAELPLQGRGSQLARPRRFAQGQILWRVGVSGDEPGIGIVGLDDPH